MDVPWSYHKRRKTSMDVTRTQWQCSESVEQTFSSLSRSHHVNGVPTCTTTCLRCHYVRAVLTTPLLRSYFVLIRPRPYYAFFNMFKFRLHEDLTTLHLRPPSSYCVHHFFKDVVRTWLSVRGVYLGLI